MRPAPFTATRAVHGTVLRLAGELDLAGVPELEKQLGEALAADGALTIDLTDLEFIDSSGIAVLVRFHNSALETGLEYTVIEGPAPVQRAFVLCGLDRMLPFQAPPASPTPQRSRPVALAPDFERRPDEPDDATAAR